MVVLRECYNDQGYGSSQYVPAYVELSYTKPVLYLQKGFVLLQ